MTETVSDSTANIDGSPVGVHSSTPPPSAQIQISGFSNIRKSGNSELAFVSDKAPERTVKTTGGFPIQVPLRLGRNDGGCSRVCSSQGKEMNDVGMIKIEDFKC